MKKDDEKIEKNPPKDIWYYTQGRHRYGPLSFSELQVQTENGNLDQSDLVWRSGFKGWVPAADIPNLFRIERITAVMLN